MFQFHEPGELTDGDLELVLHERYPGNPEIGHVPAYKFNIMRAGYDEPVGEIKLRVGDLERIKLYFGHIGYSVLPEHRGHRFAARSIRLLVPLMQLHGQSPVWITCAPDNIASRRTCELAGAQWIETVELPEDTVLYEQGHRLACRYRLDV